MDMVFLLALRVDPQVVAQMITKTILANTVGMNGDSMETAGWFLVAFPVAQNVENKI